jgi:hypothetical protein
MTFIYCLITDNVPFYIGKTRRPQSRFNSHKRQFQCEILILDEVDDSEWKFWEQHYISLFKSWGFKLKNKNNGGGGPTTIIFSEERNQKISRATMGIPRPNSINGGFKPGHKINLNRVQSEETISLIRLKAINRVQSDETKLKRSNSLKNHQRTEEHNLNLRKPKSFVPKGPEHGSYGVAKPKLFIDKISKPILQYDLEGNFIKEWPSTTEAKKHHKGDIGACCLGKQKTAGGYIWKYKG